MAVVNDCKRRGGLLKKPDEVRLLHGSAKLSRCGRGGDLLSKGKGGIAFFRGESKSLELLVSSEFVNEGVRGKGSCAVTGGIATAIAG